MNRDSIVPSSAFLPARWLRFFLLWSFLFTCQATAFGQSVTTQYILDSWGTKQGLPQNSVMTMVQTSDGYLWMGTFGGLVRFDGVRFAVFNAANTPALVSSRIPAVLETRSGDLWIGADGALSRLKDGRFTTFTQKEGLPGRGFWPLCEDRAGNLWLGWGVALVKYRDGRFTSYTTADGLPSNSVNSVTEDNDGNLWIGTDKGLARLRDGQFQIYSQQAGLSDPNVKAVRAAKDGSLWIGTNTAGLVRFSDGKHTTFTTADGLASNQISCLYEDRQGNLWIGNQTHGLNRLAAGTLANNNRRGRLFTAISARDGLASDNVACLTEDDEGSLWVGTTTGGVSRLTASKVTVFADFPEIPNSAAVPITQDAEGSMWIGITCGGLARVKDGVTTLFTQSHGLPDGCIWSLLADTDGSLWMGTWGRGIARMKNGRITRFTKANNGLPSDEIIGIYRDRAGALWLGSNQGLHRWTDGKFQSFRIADGLPDNHIRFISEDRSGKLLIGTSGGMSLMKDGKFTNHTTENGLPNNMVRAIHEAEDGSLWIGTYGGGLARLHDGRFTYFTTKQGLFEDVVSRILDDGQGNYWLTGNQGISCVSKQELAELAAGRLRSLKPVVYGVADGMKSNECNGGGLPAGWRARDGSLWFPTQRGAAVLRPESIAPNLRPPPVVIEDCFIDREATSFADQVRIEPGKTSLEIHYTGLSLIKSEQVRFLYKLAGMDPDWVEAGTRRTAYYSYLPPGEYQFTVIAANSDGVWNTEGRSLRVVVVPRFWQTWWFVGLVGIVVAGTVFLAYERRVLQLKKERESQEVFARQLIVSQEGERKRIAAELHDSLGQNLLVIKNRAILGEQVADESTKAKEQFGEITDAVTQALSEVREIAYNLRPYHLDRVGLTSAMEAMVEKMADASVIRFIVEVAPVDKLFPDEVELSLYRIAQECLNNIVKHSGATEASFMVARESHGITMTISDNGRGFSPESVAADSSKRGFGLLGIAERVRLLGGVSTLRSTPGQGTTTTVKLTLPDQTKSSSQ